VCPFKGEIFRLGKTQISLLTIVGGLNSPELATGQRWMLIVVLTSSIKTVIPMLKINPHHGLKGYAVLNRIGLIKTSYMAKIMAVAFLGIHIPLLTLLASFVLSTTYSLEATIRILSIALGATLVGTALTLYILRLLLSPVVLTARALKAYRDTKTLLKLPIQFQDEAGILMANTTKTLHQLDDLINYICNYDGVTGLPNRDFFCHRVTELTTQQGSRQMLVAILVVSVDDFVTISHGLGPERISFFLRALGQRLQDLVPNPHLLAHLDAGNFAIAALELQSFEAVIRQSQLIAETLEHPFYVSGRHVKITTSIGISMQVLEAAPAIDQTLQEASLALQEAKLKGRGQHQFYSPEMNQQLQERLQLEHDLHGALERDEFEVYYQPLIDLETQQIIAVEALIRWHHPTRGLVSPGQFIPIIEANDLILPIGEWVLRAACAQNATWQRLGLPSVRMSVNLSARQFEQANLVDLVDKILLETHLSPTLLELEVTESFLMADIQKSIGLLKQLQSRGITIALDDFGTGYSSLSYLKKLPVDILKIDQSFVKDLLTNRESALVTDAILAMAKGLHLQVTAEGIETQEQLAYLRRQGCHEGQGFYFSPPIPAEAMTHTLARARMQPIAIVS
jgi:diguanylate cyclase (GGDEF)-like protein